MQQADDPCRFLIYEVFESEQAVADHKNSAHYLIWRDSVADLMQEPRKGIKYNVIEPSDVTRW
jgi:(4S)-4-hydroxy-5-phosphonooxypentane-2,3-dione isomerase